MQCAGSSRSFKTWLRSARLTRRAQSFGLRSCGLRSCRVSLRAEQDVVGAAAGPLPPGLCPREGARRRGEHGVAARGLRGRRSSTRRSVAGAAGVAVVAEHAGFLTAASVRFTLPIWVQVRVRVRAREGKSITMKHGTVLPYDIIHSACHIIMKCLAWAYMGRPDCLQDSKGPKSVELPFTFLWNQTTPFLWTL